MNKEVESLNRQSSNKETESVIKDLSTKPLQDQTASSVTSTKHSRRITINPFEILPKIIREKNNNNSKLILWDYQHPNTTARQRHHKQRKLNSNILDEQKYKNF